MEREFDQEVLRALEKWPNVPACYGWLKLDRRGNWLIKEQAITHKRAIEFLSRNYSSDEAGQWFAQNGPQRAYCDLDYTPWVYHLDGRDQILTHTHRVVNKVDGLVVDEDGNLLLETEFGIGLMHDSDLTKFVEILAQHQGEHDDVDELMTRLLELSPDAKQATQIWWQNEPLTLRAVICQNVPSEFRFVDRPTEGSDGPA
ncbi:MAG: DUF2946 family protein [Gammaproteobacteria bacterium]